MPREGTFFELPSKKEKQESTQKDFFEVIGRPELREALLKNPWGYFSMEMYRDDIKGQGGLGMLASDTLEIMKRERIPAVFVTPLYPREAHQGMEGFDQRVDILPVDPLSRGFEKKMPVTISTRINGEVVPTILDVYQKREGTVILVGISEPNLGELYQGENNSDHRLYQEVSLGFGGRQALEQLGMVPSLEQLNESPTVFAALGRLDGMMQGGIHDLPLALDRLRTKTLYTNHTLVPAAEAAFTRDQFERFVFPNIQTPEIVEWLRGLVDRAGGQLRLSTIAFELAGKQNGVSRIHAREASTGYTTIDGNMVHFDAVTNGIALDRWGDPEFLGLLRGEGILDEHDLPVPDALERIDRLPGEKLRRIKNRGRERLVEYLHTQRINQYGEHPQINVKQKVLEWSRRMAGYKRPGMIFARPDELESILEASDMVIVLAGRAHPADQPMQRELRRILELVDSRPILKKRIHFVQDYDENLARHLAHGSDLSLNTPVVRDHEGQRVSTEACGTSWEKKILGNAIIVSTPDGGVADPEIVAGENYDRRNTPYLEIEGRTYDEEVNSLYEKLRTGAALIDGPEEEWAKYVKRQLQGFVGVISGSRMLSEYLNLTFPKEPEIVQRHAA